MKILYITQYFYPEIGATTNRALANARYLSQKGHSVTVLTEMPNHPKGIIFNGYKHKIFMKEKMENFLINRVWVFTSVKKNFITRILFYVSFMFMGFLHTLFNWKKYDIVYVSSPPLFVGVIGLWLKKIFKKTKFVFEVRDLWPNSAIQLGELKSRVLIKFSEKLEYAIYKSADNIITISEHMKNAIVKRDIITDKIITIHNGTDFNYKIVELLDPKIEIFQKFKNKKVILYAGNIGIAQNLDIILKSAELLKNKNEYYFLIVGEGPRRKELENVKVYRNLDNLEFIGEVCRDKIPYYLAQADCGIVSLRKLPLFHGALPSKIFDYMACGLPILVGIDGEAKELIETSKTGLYYQPENAQNLVEKIQELLSDDQVLKIFSKNAVDFVKQNFTRKKQAEKLEKKLLKLVKK